MLCKYESRASKGKGLKESAERNSTICTRTNMTPQQIMTSSFLDIDSSDAYPQYFLVL